eukprot:TRINITY_DN8797_c0_g1_i1.p1 TRINITY_DN8797_c0_g1~~TRINITY_DN8797_c0_g1_i1.p1  ORF type:complete len:285 (+),score=70.44 TRINITY_DN8797_c0_g1_i1:332-1186(+)
MKLFFGILIIFLVNMNFSYQQQSPLPPIKFDAIYVLGAVIWEESGFPEPIVPATSANVRSTAAAIISNITANLPITSYAPQTYVIPPKYQKKHEDDKYSRVNTIIAGGYNEGVRYNLGGYLIEPANTTFAAYSNARNGESEAFVMKEWMQSIFNIPESTILVEETSTSTIENAQVSNILLTRLAQYTFDKQNLNVGLVTNLYHMGRALQNFKDYSYKYATFTPLYAEDYICLVQSQYGDNWINTLYNYYEESYPQYNPDLLKEIMQLRQSGNYTYSVGYLEKYY